MRDQLALMEEMRRDFNLVIDFAISTDEPAAFLKAWREGDWDGVRREWPEFVNHTIGAPRGPSIER